MLFAFRGIRMFQFVLAIAALACGVGAAVALNSFLDDDVYPMLFVALFLGLVFLWAFSAALRAPTSFVAVTEERTRIRFAGFVDTVIHTSDITDATLRRKNILHGIGVRTNFKGDVSLVSTWGEVVELSLSKPMRVWLIPRLIPLRAERLTLSLRNPQKAVDRFGAPRTPHRPAAVRKSRQRGS